MSATHYHGSALAILTRFSSTMRRRGVQKSQACLDHFQEALEDCDLHDLGFTGDAFTWRNKQFQDKDYIREWLDCAVANGGWRDLYPLMQVQNGDPFHSDHRLVIVSLEGAVRRGLSSREECSFKFEAS